MNGHGPKLQSIMIDAGNTHFKQWHQSRRRTLDELESKGVLDSNFFNIRPPSSNPLQNGKSNLKSSQIMNPIDTPYSTVSTKAQYGIHSIFLYILSICIKYIQYI